MPIRDLALTATEVTGRWRWRWVLTDAATGTRLAEHTVRLNPDRWEVTALTDLDAYLSWRAEPDRRVASEAELVARLGEFVGREVLGVDVLAALRGVDPARLRIHVGDAPFLTALPLELAELDGVPLAWHERLRVSFVTTGARRRTPPTGPVRMLAVFSLPTGTTALRLRSERQRLTSLIRGLDRSIELEVMQWGVTRAALADAMARDGGPDLLHLSGHGRQGRILLEGPDGRPDEIGAGELVELARPARDRLRLAFLSACESALAPPDAPPDALPDPPSDPPSDSAGPAGPADSFGPAGLGALLAQELECTVLAMRYPVTDDFAGDLAAAFYQGLIDEGLEAGAAAARAVRAAAGPDAAASRPALSLAAPVLIGPDDMVLDLPPAGPSRPASTGLIPPEPERFVGRDGLMTAAAEVLRPGSGVPILVLTGMAAVGKTTCAVELAHRHRDEFGAMAFWAAPERDAGLSDGPAAFVEAVERALGDVPEGGADLGALLDRADRRSTLLVLDNAESLLSEEGQWHDPRWADLLAAVAARTGPTRLVVTSRVPPAAPAGPRLRHLEVGLLSGGEADALVRQLPRLRRLLHIDGPAAADDRRDRALVAAVQAAAGGHPRLLELADAAAGDPATLPDLLRTGIDETLDGWTRQAIERLDPDARLLLQILAVAEPAHRFPSVLDHAWPEVRAALGRPETPPPVAALAQAALTHLRGDRYELHPVVAQVARAGADAEVAATVDTVLAQAWERIALAQGEADTSVVVGAHLSAVPYLLRLDQQARAAANLSAALARDAGPRTARMALPLVRALAPDAPVRELLLGFAYQPLDPDEAERLLRAALASGDDDVAGAAAGALANQLHQQGRLTEAAALAGQARRLGERYGPWTQASSRLRELQVLHETGRSEAALAEVTGLLDEIRALPPDGSGATESVVPWAVREAALGLAVSAALSLERWQVALDHNGEQLDSVQRRGAAEAEIAFAWFNDAGALIRLGRFDEARQVLDYCQRVFDEQGDELRLSRVFGTRALLASEQGDLGEAVELERTALRLGYRHPLAEDLAAGHGMLGNHLAGLGVDPAGQIGHHLAAALLTRLVGSETLRHRLRMVAGDLDVYGRSWLPDDLAALAARVERVPGVRFLDVVRSLLAPGADAEAEFRGLLADTQASVEEAGYDATGYLMRWESRMPLIAAAAAGEERATRPMALTLQSLERGTDGWGLPAAFRRIIAGQRDESSLVSGLNPADAAVVRRALATIAWHAKVTGAATEAERFALTEGDLRAATDEGDRLRAGTRAAELSGLLRVRQEFTAALRYADDAIAHERRVGFGPWRQRFNLGRRLQLVADLGRPEEVLAALEPLRPHLRGEPDLPTPADPANPSVVRENLLTLGQQAALALGRWELALGFHEDRAASAELRGADAAELAELRLDRVRCLIGLGRTAEARSQLDEIRPLLRGDDPALAVEVASYDATLAGGTTKAAEALAEAYRRLSGGGLDPRLVARQHVVLSQRLGQEGEPAGEAAHLLAAALICALVGDRDTAALTLRHAALHLYQADGTRLAVTLPMLVAEVERVPGVRFGHLVTRVIGTPDGATDRLAAAVRAAYAIPLTELFAFDRLVADLEDEIAVVVAAATGGEGDRAAVEATLAGLAGVPDMVPLVAALRRAAAGDLPSESEQQAMHPVHAAVLAEVRARLGD
ncbi:CHAT domain-containing protein [Micromonospora sp. WMMD712]|uniref:CHAT domain-containing protein n=1 Tax=Micromonospora sp. WMMD712 TaxID=3016096 RepID=UPI00249C379C|nr:CHAT domain-containing protein [Micromonospora sp. WMMD712]WFE58555.1 CHAT domain-containing protein [Micromonospora sp. WMMD712]